MLKVFGRKKASTAPPTPTPTPVPTPSAPRALRTPQHEPPPPLYARFATRGESIDSASVRSSSTNPSYVGSKPGDNVRADYTRNVQSANRVYGNESVTRFGSGELLASPRSSKRDISLNADEPAVIVNKKRLPPSRLASQSEIAAQPSSSSSPTKASPLRTTSGPKPLASRSRVQKSTDDFEEQFAPPRAPALTVKQSSTSFGSERDFSGSSIASSSLDQPRPKPASSRVPTSNTDDEVSGASNGTREPTLEELEAELFNPQLPPKFTTSRETPPSYLRVVSATKDSASKSSSPSRPVSGVSSTSTVRPTIPASALVHPAFKPRDQSSISASAIVHPSQRLRKPSTSTSNGTSPIPTLPSVTSTPVSTPAPAPRPQAQPQPRSQPVPQHAIIPPTPTDPSTAIPAVFNPPSPIPAKAASPTPSPTARPASPSPSTASSNNTSSAGPSSHRDLGVSAARRLSRRLSADFGTYDIHAARREREKLMGGTLSRDVPPTPGSPDTATSTSSRRQSLFMVPMTSPPASEKPQAIEPPFEAVPPSPPAKEKLPALMLSIPDTPEKPSAQSSGSTPTKATASPSSKIAEAQAKLKAALEWPPKTPPKASPAAIDPPRSRAISEETITPLVATSSKTPQLEPSQIPEEPQPVGRPVSSRNITPPAPSMITSVSQSSSISSTASSTFSSMSDNTRQTSISSDDQAGPSTTDSIQPTKLKEVFLPPNGHAAELDSPMSDGLVSPSPLKIRKKRALPTPPSETSTPTPIATPSQNSPRPLDSPIITVEPKRPEPLVMEQRPPTERILSNGSASSSRPLPTVPSPSSGARSPQPQAAPSPPPLPPSAIPVRIESRSPVPSSTQNRRDSVVTYEEEGEQAEDDAVETFYPLESHLREPNLLATLLLYLTFNEALPLFVVTKASRKVLEDTRELKEVVLERYLSDTVGYRRWSGERMGKRKEPLSLSIRDLNSYMRGVSISSVQYTTVADSFLTALATSTSTSANATRAPVPKHLTNHVRMLASSTRAYTKVVLRLRAQAEAEAAHLPAVPPDNRGRGTPSKYRMPATGPGTHPPTSGPSSGLSRRSPSPAFSFTSYDRYGSSPQSTGPVFLPSAPAVSTTPGKFKSPLFRAGHAALLRVFVPSPEGAWLSDASVLECERELKRAGVLGLLKVGDVVHDMAAGDEANTGRLIWDGNYLIDLDYAYSPLGEVPHYIDSLAFPPSYWHKIIRTSGNPIVHMDLTPWAVEIANHLQLLQDRVQTDTPQGSQHTVLRWVHRTRLRIRANTPVNVNAPPVVASDGSKFVRMIDQGWHGTIVLDAEGTNEGLADLQARIGNSVMLFPVKTLTGRRMSGEGAGPVDFQHGNQGGGKTVFRLLRSQSRPGEIWLRCVREKEKIS